MLPTRPTPRQLQQPALPGCHPSRDWYLQGGMSPCPLQLLSRFTHSVPRDKGSALLWESPVLGLGEDSRSTACASPWPGGVPKAPIHSPLSLSAVWIVGVFTFIYLRVFCYCDFFLSLFLSWDHQDNTAVSGAIDGAFLWCL